MELELIEPSLEYETAFMDMLKEFQDSNGPIPYVMHFSKTVFEDILQATIDRSCGINVELDMEPSTTWWLKSQDQLIGIVNIRHKLNGFLENYGGHIGYGIRPSQRCKGYATELLALALPKCAILGLKRVLITCERSNIASEKVILNNGGILEDERLYGGSMMLRYWIAVSEAYGSLGKSKPRG